MFNRMIQASMASDLKKAYKEVRWVGNFPTLPENESVFFYMNHQHYFDGHLVWLLGWRIFKRPFWVWMEEWDRFPFLRVLGALPFPKNDLRKRIKVMQFTQEALKKEKRDIYFFPEATLHSPQEALLTFPSRIFERMDTLTHHKHWLPIAIKAYITTDARPILLVTCGEMHSQIDGQERQRLENALDKLSQHTLPQTLLFSGTPNPDTLWNFKFLKRFFDI